MSKPTITVVEQVNGVNVIRQKPSPEATAERTAKQVAQSIMGQVATSLQALDDPAWSQANAAARLEAIRQAVIVLLKMMRWVMLHLNG